MSSRWIAHHAEVLDALAGMENDSFDGSLNDVPYALGTKQPKVDDLIAYLRGAELDTGGDFMGAGWSAPSVRVWRELYRVLKPGAHVLSFAGSRTGDLISLGMRAAGFEVRDTLLWLYMSAMPKSLDVSKAIDKSQGAARQLTPSAPMRAKINAGEISPNRRCMVCGLARQSAKSCRCPRDSGPATEDAEHWDGFGSGIKPCYEPVILARKPFKGRLIDNVRKWGCGALAIDLCRIEYESDGDKAAAAAAQRACQDQNAGRTTYGNFNNGPGSLPGFFAKQDLGRWPPNVIVDEGVAAMLDAQSGDRPGMSGGGVHRADYGGGMFGSIDSTATARNDSGGISRFLYVAKASREERERGCDHLPRRTASATVKRKAGSVGIENGRAGAGRTEGARNFGPCVKPVDLTRWLASLIQPPPHKDGSPRRLINLYSGTGSEMIGGILSGWEEVVGVEREPRPGSKDDFMSILRARVHLAATNPRAFDPDVKRGPKADERQTDLFGRTGT